MLLVMFRMLSSMTSAMAPIMPSACARLRPSRSSRCTKWWVSKWKSCTACDAWKDRAKADDSTRENLDFDGPDALMRKKSVDLYDGTERLAGLNVPARREWAKRVVVVLIDMWTRVGKLALQEPNPNLCSNCLLLLSCWHPNLCCNCLLREFGKVIMSTSTSPHAHQHQHAQSTSHNPWGSTSGTGPLGTSLTDTFGQSRTHYQPGYMMVRLSYLLPP